MTRTPVDDTHPVKPGCEPWSSPDGSGRGALVLHGFTGTPISMRPIAEALAAAGFAVEMPRLPGHGTHIDDMLPTTFADWLAEAERALATVRSRVDGGPVVVVGLSMGGVLTGSLGVAHDDLAGLVCINTPMRIPEEIAVAVEAMIESGTEVMDSVGGDIADPDADEGSYDATPLRPLQSLIAAGDDLLPRLGEIRCPLLVITSRQDHVVNPADSDLLADAVSGPVERVWLEQSYHVAPIDLDGPLVCERTVEFATRVTADVESSRT
jgi:carboxylesterase